MTLKVAIIGANGKVARLLVGKLAKLTTEFDTTAIIRNPDQVQQFKDLGVNASVTSITDSVANITKALTGFDAVVFSAGAGGKGGVENTLLVDLDGAAKVMEACKAAKVNRFVMVSALKADDREFWYKTGLRNYYICKMFADKELRQSGLDYTILRPGSLADGEGTGKFIGLKACEAINGADLYNASIFRDDVASVIIECLRNNKTIGKTISLLNGDVPLADAFKEL